MSQHSLTGGKVDVGRDEAAEFGVIVSALEIVEPGFLVIHITPIAAGLVRAEFLLSTSKNRRCDTTALVRSFLKPLRDWDYPNNLPFVPKMRCFLV